MHVAVDGDANTGKLLDSAIPVPSLAD